MRWEVMVMMVKNKVSGWYDEGKRADIWARETGRSVEEVGRL